MKNPILSTILLTSLFWFLGCYVYLDLTKEECVDCLSIIEDNNTRYQTELDSLKALSDSLNREIQVVTYKTDSLRNSITARNKELNKLRIKYNEAIANIDNMSNDELGEFFSNRYK